MSSRSISQNNQGFAQLCRVKLQQVKYTHAVKENQVFIKSKTGGLLILDPHQNMESSMMDNKEFWILKTKNTKFERHQYKTRWD